MNWDTYFHEICITVSRKSTCLSRNIGAILVRDNSVISTGYNGPPRGIPHCGYDRAIKDPMLNNLLISKNLKSVEFGNSCPRKVLGYPSGTHMELCPAQHAEENAVSNAARQGVIVLGSTLYMNTVIPCQKCFGTLINAGVVEIVVDILDVYDEYTKYLMNFSNIKLRQFNLIEKL
jgi:dCMP deaminase